MDRISIDSFAKINLLLDVLYKRQDGYHEINTIMQEIDLKDKITIENRGEGIIIETNCKDLPINEDNLAYKAWDTLSKELAINKGVYIKIEKNIPIAAGLAGGSSNAASVLKGLNKLWNLNLSLQDLQRIGLKIGADVPFCLLGGTAYAKGVGEDLRPLKKFKNKLILIADLGIPISTAYVYNKLDLNGKSKTGSMDNIIGYIEANDLDNLPRNLFNTMEDVVIKEYPLIQEIKNDILRLGGLGALMTGSGPTVFGIFDNRDKMEACKAILEKKVKKVYISRTI